MYDTNFVKLLYKIRIESITWIIGVDNIMKKPFKIIGTIPKLMYKIHLISGVRIYGDISPLRGVPVLHCERMEYTMIT